VGQRDGPVKDWASACVIGALRQTVVMNSRVRAPLTLLAAVGLSTVLGVGVLVGVAGAATSLVHTGAVEIPGTNSANTGAEAGFGAVSCGSSSSCSVGGTYLGEFGQSEVFVSDMVHGTWQSMTYIPGLGQLNSGGDGALTAMSCTGNGSCSAGGSYTNGANDSQAFVADEVGGVWRAALEVPASGVLNATGFAGVTSLACSSPGNCVAGGYYNDALYRGQSFVASETHGVWEAAEPVPGVTALNSDGDSQVSAVSCPADGACTVGGYYTDGQGNQQVYVSDETDGVWGQALTVPNSTNLSVGGWANINSLSCGSAGNCSLGGFYKDASNVQEAFLASELNGVWGPAFEVMDSSINGAENVSSVSGVSCSNGENCTAVGVYRDLNGTEHGFFVTQSGGVWGEGKALPTPPSPAVDGFSSPSAISCVGPNLCDVTGSYSSAGSQDSYVSTDNNGVWTAKETVGSSRLGNDGVLPEGISCTAVSTCSLGGIYQINNSVEDFIANTKGPTVGKNLAPKEVHVTATSLQTGTITVHVSSLEGVAPVLALGFSLNGKAQHYLVPPRSTFTIRHLKAGSIYDITVRAWNYSGTSARSNEEIVAVR
jgi:hypothetical protein